MHYLRGAIAEGSGRDRVSLIPENQEIEVKMERPVLGAQSGHKVTASIVLSQTHHLYDTGRGEGEGYAGNISSYCLNETALYCSFFNLSF